MTLEIVAIDHSANRGTYEEPTESSLHVHAARYTRLLYRIWAGISNSVSIIKIGIKGITVDAGEVMS